MTHVINNAHKAMLDTRLPPVPHEVDLGNMRLVLLPPGPLDLKMSLAAHTFDVALGGGQVELAINSDRMIEKTYPGQSISYQPLGTEIQLRVTNTLPDCLLEVDDATLRDWLAGGEIDRTHALDLVVWQQDQVAAEIGRASIKHLMRAARSNTPTDRLTVEALALGIAARGIAQLVSPDGDIDAEITRWDRTARSTEISRAIDLIEARLTDSALSITDLADAACLSSSRFSSIFRSMVGETPYAFILRRRAEFARDLIIGTREPLSQIAYHAGFSSQAHMTVVLRRVFGITPAAMRN